MINKNAMSMKIRGKQNKNDDKNKHRKLKGWTLIKNVLKNEVFTIIAFIN